MKKLFIGMTILFIIFISPLYSGDFDIANPDFIFSFDYLFSNQALVSLSDQPVNVNPEKYYSAEIPLELRSRVVWL